MYAPADIVDYSSNILLNSIFILNLRYTILHTIGLALMPPKKYSKSTSTKTKVDIKPKDTKNKTTKLADQNKDKSAKTVKPTDIKYEEPIEVEQEEQDQESDAEMGDITEVDNLPELTPSVVKENNSYKPVLQREIVIIDNKNRRTSDIMSKFEMTEIISHRAQQINNGGRCFTDTGDIIDPIAKARKELYDKKCPLSIFRYITDDICEVWTANELAIPMDY
jgi:DNA-directed RNA polymerase subunit K/omega